GAGPSGARRAIWLWEGDLPSDEPVNDPRTSQELVDRLQEIKDHPVAPSPKMRRDRAAAMQELQDRRARDEGVAPVAPEDTDLTQEQDTDLDRPDAPAEEPAPAPAAPARVVRHGRLGRTGGGTWDVEVGDGRRHVVQGSPGPGFYVSHGETPDAKDLKLDSTRHDTLEERDAAVTGGPVPKVGVGPPDYLPSPDRPGKGRPRPPGEVVRDPVGGAHPRHYVRQVEGKRETRRYEDGSVTIIDLSRPAG